MSLKNTPALHTFLSAYFSEADPESDTDSVQAFARVATPAQREQVLAQAHLIIEQSNLSVEELGIETNRWFSTSEEACAWISQLADVLTSYENTDAPGAGNSLPKDVNGALLSEGDSVQIIKDLKVRGGTSDLKRGTLVKKIHLIGDPENIECRVDGSTLVLKTCFLKKA